VRVSSSPHNPQTEGPRLLRRPSLFQLKNVTPVFNSVFIFTQWRYALFPGTISAVLLEYSCTFKNITEQCAEENICSTKKREKKFTRNIQRRPSPSSRHTQLYKTYS
jgi:hypothetical protein